MMTLPVLSCLILTPKICHMTPSVKHLQLLRKTIFRWNFYSSERVCLGQPNLVLDVQFCFVLLDSKPPIIWTNPPVHCQCLTIPSKGKVSALCLARHCFVWYPQSAELCNTCFQNKRTRHWVLFHFCRCEGAGWISFSKTIRKSLQFHLSVSSSCLHELSLTGPIQIAPCSVSCLFWSLLLVPLRRQHLLRCAILQWPLLKME